jgi:malonyl-CoA O-methyltransferase
MSFKFKISDDFSKAAKKYNLNASLQKDVATRLAAIASNAEKKGTNHLDLGSGTGFICQEFGKRFDSYQLDIAYNMCKISEKFAPTINGDIENLPLKSESFDFITSSLAIQWAEDLNRVAAEIHRVLKKGGRAYISTLLSGTLRELKYVLSKFDRADRVNDFLHANDFAHIFESSGFKIEKVDLEDVVKSYGSALDLMKNIKNIGASSKSENFKAITISTLADIEISYQNYFSANEEVYATWSLGYFILHKF